MIRPLTPFLNLKDNRKHSGECSSAAQDMPTPDSESSVKPSSPYLQTQPPAHATATSLKQEHTF